MKRTQLIIGAIVYIGVTVGGYILISTNTPYRALDRVAPVPVLEQAANELSWKLPSYVQSSMAEGVKVEDDDITQIGKISLTPTAVNKLDELIDTFEKDLISETDTYFKESEILTAEQLENPEYTVECSTWSDQGVTAIDSESVSFNVMMGCDRRVGDYLDSYSVSRDWSFIYTKADGAIVDVRNRY